MRTDHKDAGSWLDGIAALIAVGAGVYLLLTDTVASDSYIAVIGHGMGAYFVAKGIFIGRSLHLQARMVDLIDREDY